jgi:hypothetical protein
MVRVLEKKVEEDYVDRLWRIVLRTTEEMVGSRAVIIADLFPIIANPQSSLRISPDTRIIAYPQLNNLDVDYNRLLNPTRGISIHSILHRLSVYDAEHYDLAHRLAEAYEQRLRAGLPEAEQAREEFTLQKEYHE